MAYAERSSPTPVHDVRAEIVAAIPAMRAFARSFYKYPDQADDLVQDTLMNAWRHIDQYTPGTNLKSWMFTIMRNTFITQYRRQRREAVGAIEDVAELSRAQAPGQVWKLRANEVQTALHKLPPEQRSAIVLCCVMGHSYQEAASIWDCECGTIKSRINRGKARLLVLLGEPSRSSVLDDKVLHVDPRNVRYS